MPSMVRTTWRGIARRKGLLCAAIFLAVGTSPLPGLGQSSRPPIAPPAEAVQASAEIAIPLQSSLRLRAGQSDPRGTRPIRVAEVPPLAGGGFLPQPQAFRIPLSQQPDSPQPRIEVQDGLLSFVVRDAPLKDVLKLIAQSRNLNLVCASDVNSNITLALDRVRLEDALDAILSSGGYTWSQRNGIIHVTSVNTGTRLAPGVQGRKVVVFELDYASAVDVDQAVKGILSPIGQSFVSQSSPTDNRRTREVIVVEDLPSYLERTRNYIAQIDRPPRQVMIQVHVLEVDLNEENRNGVNFKTLFNIANTKVSISTKGLANAGAPQAFFAELTGGNLESLVEALRTTTDAKTLASPRVLAVSGQESRIQIGEQLGFRVTTTTETSTLESVDFLDVGVVLSVTPRISRDNHVLMRVKPEVSSGLVNPDTGLPEEKTTEVQTDVLLRDGQGIVIGGLIQEKDTNVQSKIPVLGDMLYLGTLFQRREVVKQRSEIIIALVPYVLPYDEVNASRDDCEVARCVTPLLEGPLRRVPRPTEPRLPDTFYNPLGVAQAPIVSYPNRRWKHDLYRLPPTFGGSRYPSSLSIEDCECEPELVPASPEQATLQPEPVQPNTP